jgi:hypothetical protein
LFSGIRESASGFTRIDPIPAALELDSASRVKKTPMLFS